MCLRQTFFAVYFVDDILGTHYRYELCAPDYPCVPGCAPVGASSEHYAVPVLPRSEVLRYPIMLHLVIILRVVSCCSSGDATVIHWDTTTGRTLHRFDGHASDVTFLAVHPHHGQTFLTSSVDRTCRLWDVRERRSVQTLDGHQLDVNSVSFFPDGNAFGPSSLLVFDMCACR